MPTIITALLYSGRPDPSWELTNAQEEQLKKMLFEEKEKSPITSAFSLGLLGYRGFLVESIGNMEIPKSTYVFDGLIDFPEQRSFTFIDKESKLEQFLLETSREHVDKEESKRILEEIEKNAAGGPAFLTKEINKEFKPLVEPPYNPGKWNYEPVLSHNNCYNYANDKITNTFAQPGLGSGQMYTALACGNVGPAAQRDGQIPVSNVSSTPAEGQYIALVVAPNSDYHWYRRDANGLWSHKPGRTPARNVDNSGNLIRDPRNCNRGPYTDFCGFYQSIPSRTRIR
ncbi:MAG TPA: hypothetical protein VNW04_05785 [Puia sp.]|nr:hypothetical protein [Puia sp.]